MVKVEIEKYITVKMEMSLDEAKEMLDTLDRGPGSHAHWKALRDAITEAEKLVGEE